MLMPETSNSRLSTKTWALWGIAALSIIGCVMHFIYDWSGKLTVVGLFAPTNESVWEHLKLTFWPMFIWWFAGYCILRKNVDFSYPHWFMSCTAAQLVCPLVIISFYYTYTGALGIESLILDIFSLFLALACSQGLAYHVYKYSKSSSFKVYCSIFTLILLATAFILFTFIPPHIPVFMDSLTGGYGI